LASIPIAEASVIQYLNTLAVLLGLYPEDVTGALSTMKPLPDYMEPVGVGVPGELLLRRPDVRGAERQVNAQAALLGASKRDWLPEFFLNGSFGYASHDMKDMGKKGSMTWSIAPSMTWNIFSGGRNLQEERLQQAQLDESINQFNQTVLTAVQEVDNAMSAYKNSIKQIVACREMLYQGKEAFDLSLDLYKQGLTPFQNVLDAQRSLLGSQDNLVQTRGYSLLSLIQLYKALGGGW
jgi:outer membrane protein TolC